MSEGEKKPENLVPVYKKNFIVSLLRLPIPKMGIAP